MWHRRRRSDEQFRAEIEAHVALETDQLIADGLSRDEASARARRTVGNRRNMAAGCWCDRRPMRAWSSNRRMLRLLQFPHEQGQRPINNRPSPLTCVNGRLKVPSGPGLGVTIDPSFVAKAQTLR